MTASASALSHSTAIVRRSVRQQMFAALGNLHCRLFHEAISRPVAGKYRCWKCLREFDLEW